MDKSRSIEECPLTNNINYILNKRFVYLECKWIIMLYGHLKYEWLRYTDQLFAWIKLLLCKNFIYETIYKHAFKVKLPQSQYETSQEILFKIFQLNLSEYYFAKVRSFLEKLTVILPLFFMIFSPHIYRMGLANDQNPISDFYRDILVKI